MIAAGGIALLVYWGVVEGGIALLAYEGFAEGGEVCLSIRGFVDGSGSSYAIVDASQAVLCIIQQCAS